MVPRTPKSREDPASYGLCWAINFLQCHLAHLFLEHIALSLKDPI